MADASATLATNLLAELTAGQDFSVPNIDLSGEDYQLPEGGDLAHPVTKLANADLTTGDVNGTGTLDILMKGLGAQLQDQYDKNRITGEQFAKAYVELTAGAMQNAVAFLLGKDTSYWQAVVAQQQARAAEIGVVTARVQLQAAKVQLQSLRYEMLNNKATFALTEMKLATESVGYDSAKYTLDNILTCQKELLYYQMCAQRAQTFDTQTDGATKVVGLIGKQKDLYAQQIVSYQRDAEVKAAKLFTDAWITMKTIDEGLLPPGNFANSSIDQVLKTLKSVNKLG